MAAGQGGFPAPRASAMRPSPFTRSRKPGGRKLGDTGWQRRGKHSKESRPRGHLRVCVPGASDSGPLSLHCCERVQTVSYLLAPPTVPIIPPPGSFLIRWASGGRKEASSLERDVKDQGDRQS